MADEKMNIVPVLAAEIPTLENGGVKQRAEAGVRVEMMKIESDPNFPLCLRYSNPPNRNSNDRRRLIRRPSRLGSATCLDRHGDSSREASRESAYENRRSRQVEPSLLEAHQIRGSQRNARL